MQNYLEHMKNVRYIDCSH